MAGCHRRACTRNVDRSGILRRQPSRLGVALKPLEVTSKFSRGLIPQIPILFQQLADDVFQLGWNRKVQPYGRNWSSIEDSVEDGCRGLSREGQGSRRHLVENGPEGKQIGAGINILSFGLLRRHVSDGAHSRTGTGEVLPAISKGSCSEGRWLGLRRERHLGQPKVQNLSVATLGEKKIRGFDVAMNNAAGMRGVQSVRHLDCKR